MIILPFRCLQHQLSILLLMLTSLEPNQMKYLLIESLFDLVLYVHGQTAEVWSGWSVTLATLFLGKPPGASLPVLSAHSLTIYWQLLFLNQWKRKNGARNIFITIYSEVYFNSEY